MCEEGWILGVGCETLLQETAQEIATGMSALEPPRLQNDCFALPPGVDWTPVDDALALLRAALRPITGIETLPTAAALGRVLARDTTARRSNPPAPNAAVDGYGFAHAATGDGPQELPLVDGRAAAGVPYTGVVPQGQAIRILTGAILPEGVDTVVLEEDCATDGARIAFNGPIKPRANTRKAGEDVPAGALALPAGRSLTPADLALLSALGIGEVAVHRRLPRGYPLHRRGNRGLFRRRSARAGQDLTMPTGPCSSPSHRPGITSRSIWAMWATTVRRCARGSTRPHARRM